MRPAAGPAQPARLSCLSACRMKRQAYRLGRVCQTNTAEVVLVLAVRGGAERNSIHSPPSVCVTFVGMLGKGRGKETFGWVELSTIKMEQAVKKKIRLGYRSGGPSNRKRYKSRTQNRIVRIRRADKLGAKRRQGICCERFVGGIVRGGMGWVGRWEEEGVTMRKEWVVGGQRAHTWFALD
ncbi:hypothetical protein BDQ17DRAFT_1412965 [Cyathus striatus]|nr:hypothetical protein BDQ17DRAFT_1412965 [Cyathus striatus]